MESDNPKASPPRFSKPRGFDARIRGSGAAPAGARAAPEVEPRSLIAARSRAALLNVSLDDLLLEDRKQLRASTYPGLECFEPYELEDNARGLSAVRRQHAERCLGCRSLLNGLVPTESQVEAFLDDVRVAEPEVEAHPVRRGFWFDVVAALTAAVAVSGAGYVVLRFVGPIAADPTLRSVVLSQVPGILHPLPVVTMWVVSVALLATLVGIYKREFLDSSGGALAAGVAIGTVAVLVGWQNATSMAATVRASLALRQVQLTDAVAASVAPFSQTSSGFDVKKTHVQSTLSFIKLTTWQKGSDGLVFTSNVEGLPGAMVADMKPNGGQVYWDFDSKQQPLGQILFGTVQSSNSDQFVLVDFDQHAHTFKKPAGSSVTTDAEMMVLFNAADQTLLSVQPIVRTAQDDRNGGR